MATFSKIDGQEPSTVTFQLATVTQDRGGQTQHQEIVTIGGSESTLAVAQVRAAAPASTEFGLVVRIADPSTGAFAISSIAGPVTVRSSAADALVSVYQSTAADLNVTVAGYVAPSTTIAVSSVSGRVATMPLSTLWGSCGGFHFDSSGGLNVNVVGGSAASTTVNVSSVAGTVVVAGNVSSNSSAYLPVRFTNGTAFVAPATDYTDGSTASNLAGPTLTFDNGSNATMRSVSLTNGFPVNVVAGAAAGSTLVTVRQSTYTDFNTLSRVADRDASTNVAAVLNDAVPASTAYGLVVRVPLNNVVAATVSTGSITIHQGSTAFSVQVSTGAVSVSTGSITVHQGSTNFSVQVSTGAVSVSTGSVTVHQGSTLFSVQARATTSSGGGVEGSTVTPVGGILGLHVRPVFPTMNSTTVVITSTHSTAIYEILSSVAALRHKVFAYFIGSTHTNPSTLIFCSSASASGFDHWAVNFGSGSSGITGANLALPPPGFIFAGIAQNALNVKIEGGSSATSTCIVRVALSWFDEA